MKTTDPLGNSTSYSYDTNGNLTEFTDRKGEVTWFTYDSLDRLTKGTYDDGSTTSYTYDPGDRLTKVDDSNNELTRWGTTKEPLLLRRCLHHLSIRRQSYALPFLA